MKALFAAVLGSLLMSGPAFAACPPFCQQQVQQPRYVAPPPPPPRQIIQQPPPRLQQQPVARQNDSVRTYNPQPVARPDRKINNDVIWRGREEDRPRTQQERDRQQANRQGGGCVVNSKPFDNLQQCIDGFKSGPAGLAYDNLGGGSRMTKSAFIEKMRGEHTRSCQSSCKASAPQRSNTPCDTVGCRNGG